MAAIKKGFEKTSDTSDVAASICSQQRRYLNSVTAEAPADQFGRRAARSAKPQPISRAQPDSAPYLERFTSAFHFRVIVPAV
jgi:hypothetical protein